MPGDPAAGDTITDVDEPVLTEHSGTPDTENTDSFPALTTAPPVTAARDPEPAVPAAAAPAHPAAPAPAPPAPGVPAPAPPAPGVPAAPATPSSLWYQAPYAIVLAGVIAGLVWAWQGSAHVRVGMVTVAAVLLAAAACRLVLPERWAGMLATRCRLLDVVTLLGLGVCVLVMAIVLPPAT
jgi:hypothetical protein